MPLRRMHSVLDEARAKELRDLLAREIAHPQEVEPEPVLVEDASRRGLKLYVIWSRWSEFDPRERSEIITDAYTRAKGAPALPHLIVAMGLTPGEAQRMGIKYQ